MPELKEFLIDKLGLRKLKEGDKILKDQLSFDLTYSPEAFMFRKDCVYSPFRHGEVLYVLDLPEGPVDARNFPVGTVVRGRDSEGYSPSSETGTYSVVSAGIGGRNRNVWSRIDHAYKPNRVVLFVDKVLFNPEEDS